MTTFLLLLMALLLIAALERNHRRQPPAPPGPHGRPDRDDRDWARIQHDLLAWEHTRAGLPAPASTLAPADRPALPGDARSPAEPRFGLWCFRRSDHGPWLLETSGDAPADW